MKRIGFCLWVSVPLWFLLPVGPGAGKDPPGPAAYNFARAIEETRPYAEAGDAGASPGPERFSKERIADFHDPL
jgi:hypothetical protein